MLVLHAGKEEFLKKLQFEGPSAEGLFSRAMNKDKKGNVRKVKPINSALLKSPLKAIFCPISQLMQFNVQGRLEFERVVKVMRGEEVIGILLLYTSKVSSNIVIYVAHIEQNGIIKFYRKGLKNREATRRKYRDFVEKLKLQEATTWEK